MMKRFARVTRSFNLTSFVAGIAFVVVLGGTAYAASQITGGDVKNSSLTGKDVKNKSLSKADFKGSVRGPQGPTGPAGSLGPAGGDLTGTYPNPTIKDGAVGSGELASGAVPHDATGSNGSTKLSANSVNYNEIGSNAVRGTTFKSSGSFTYDAPNMQSQTCAQTTINLGASNADSNDVILVTPEYTDGAPFTVTALNDSGGFFQLQVCNENQLSVNPPSRSFSYVVIDV